MPCPLGSIGTHAVRALLRWLSRRDRRQLHSAVKPVAAARPAVIRVFPTARRVRGRLGVRVRGEGSGVLTVTGARDLRQPRGPRVTGANRKGQLTLFPLPHP